ncbi:class I SAM-dependent methyltransferase [soil metagenome]
MKLAKLYDRVSESYELTDRFIVNSQCRTVALKQIAAQLDPTVAIDIVDLGVGDGEFLTHLKAPYPHAKFTGVDIADKMLELARQKLDLQTINSSLHHIDAVLPHHSYDLIVAHLILAYVKLETVLQKCSILQKDRGLVSIFTTTFESFSGSRKNLDENFERRKLVGPVGKYFYQRAIDKTLVPKSYAEIKQIAEQQGYEIVSRQTLIEDLCFEDVAGVFEFGIKGGWFITAIDYPYVPYSVLYAFVKLFMHLYVTFPITDTINFEVLLLRKK